MTDHCIVMSHYNLISLSNNILFLTCCKVSFNVASDAVWFTVVQSTCNCTSYNSKLILLYLCTHHQLRWCTLISLQLLCVT